MVRLWGSEWVQVLFLSEKSVSLSLDLGSDASVGGDLRRARGRVGNGGVRPGLVSRPFATVAQEDGVSALSRRPPRPVPPFRGRPPEERATLRALLELFLADDDDNDAERDGDASAEQ
jgi:hypothetical protein